MKGRWRWRVPVNLLAAHLFAVGTPSAFGQTVGIPGCRLEAGPAGAVARVVDGETVRLDDGREVRLIGALAPRASDVGASRGTWPFEQATIQALTRLVLGYSVEVWFGGRRTDRYGRWLAQLLVNQGRAEWVQGALLEAGMARAYMLPGNTACHAAMIARERIARDSHRGLWANAAYHIRPADKPAELLPLRHTFQLVSGIVGRTSRTRDRIYLRFSRRGRTGFLARVNPGTDVLPHGVESRTLSGRPVLVRGWLDQRGGPIMDIDTPGQLEILTADDTAPPGSYANRR